MAKSKIPKLRRQKEKNGNDRAFVVLAGVRFHLGPYGSKESRGEYDRLTVEWLANGRCMAVEPDQITIAELVSRYWDYAEFYYANPNGDASSELVNYRQAFKPLIALYSETPAKDYGPLAMKAVRQRMIDTGWCRSYINRQVFRLRRVFKWASSEEILPASVYHRLETVEGLKYGRTDAPESGRVLPVEDHVVDATLPLLTPTVRAMVTVQRLTGMRPGELCRMGVVDLDMSGDTWTYTPTHHKTQYRGRSRTIYLGPKAQEAIRPYLRNLKGYMFTPEQADRERREIMHANRKTPLSCGNVPGSHCKPRPQRKPGERYSTGTYGRAIAYGCLQAFPAPKGMKGEALKQWNREHHWSPNQLRHAFATMVRRERGLEDAQILLGHAKADVTQVYAERDEQRAIETIRKIG